MEDSYKIVNERSDEDLFPASSGYASPSQRFRSEYRRAPADDLLELLRSAHTSPYPSPSTPQWRTSERSRVESTAYPEVLDSTIQSRSGGTRAKRSELHDVSLTRSQPTVQRRGYWITVGLLVAVSVILWRFWWFRSPASIVYANLADPVIAIVGATGTGKSSIIDILGGVDKEGKRPVIGHNLESCTRNVSWYHVVVNSQAVHLLDTPGFDDTALSDSEILETLSLELARVYQDKRSLSGLIYLYDISKQRYGGQSSKNLQMFQQLVGDESLKNVVLATTHWNKQDKQLKPREEELKTKYWKMMTLHGSRIERHDGSKASATRIIQSLLAKPPTVVKIVDELVEQGLRWEDTAVGQSISEALSLFQAKVEKGLSAVTHLLSESERKRDLEAEQARKDMRALEERHSKATAEGNKRAMQAIAQMKEEMKAEQEERNKAWREKEAEARSEKDTYKKQHDETSRRQQNLKSRFVYRDPYDNGNDNEPLVPHPGSKSVRLYFRYPGYRIFDWLAWASWAILVFWTIAGQVIVSTNAMKKPNADFFDFAMMVGMASLEVWHTISFAQTFFGSCGPEWHGLVWLVVDFARMVYWSITAAPSENNDGIFGIMLIMLACMGLRYMLSSC